MELADGLLEQTGNCVFNQLKGGAIDRLFRTQAGVIGNYPGKHHSPASPNFDSKQYHPDISIFNSTHLLNQEDDYELGASCV
jgi:hypothetical protein